VDEGDRKGPEAVGSTEGNHKKEQRANVDLNAAAPSAGLRWKYIASNQCNEEVIMLEKEDVEEAFQTAHAPVFSLDFDMDAEIPPDTRTTPDKNSGSRPLTSLFSLCYSSSVFDQTKSVPLRLGALAFGALDTSFLASVTRPEEDDDVPGYSIFQYMHTQTQREIE
jgi:hypothetical protein